ncbi:MAG: MipA/OmpV family protein [Reyranella sp.]|nr:MipA/OmpV family protein [Reyranella sp.]
MHILSPAFVRRHSPYSLVFGLIVAFLSLSPSAHGQPANDPFASNGKSSAWAVTLGAGAAVRPTFEGSDRYFVSPVPLVSISYNDMISFDTSGLNAYWRNGSLQIGGGLTYNLGRLEGSNSVFTQGDERLNGLGNIPATAGLRAFANYKLGPVVLGATLTKYLADGNNGLLIDGLVEMPYQLGERTTLTGRLFATWADQSYMQTWFGVTAGQAVNSGYAIYQAESGIKNVGLGVNLRHQLGTNWMLSADARLTRLTGSADYSPITVSDVNTSFLAMLGYRF